MKRQIASRLWIVVLAALMTAPGTTGRTATRKEAVDRSSDHAAAMAVNELAAVGDGYELRHPRHRVVFSSDGLRVSPRTGGPTWSWRLARVGAAGAGNSLISAELVRPSRPDDLVVRYDRIVLDEEYVLGSASIEQHFVLHVPLPLDGRDLVVEGSVTCDGEYTAAMGRWEWRGDGGLVWLGPAVVFDADGRRLPSRFEVTGSSTRLVVDGAALVDAAYPVTIDPEIGANDFRISDMGPDGDAHYDAFYPAVAYNSTNDQYLVVWSGDSNHGGLVVGENEIFGQLLDGSGSEIGANDFRISDVGVNGDPGRDAFVPDVAWNSSRNQFLVVWMADDSAGGLADEEWEIWGQLLDSDGNELGPNDFRISRMGPDGDASYRAREPAVAYNPNVDEYLVVWSGCHNTGGLVSGEYEIWAQRVTWNGAILGSNLRMSDMGGTGNPGYAAWTPDVTCNTHDNEYLIVWAGEDNIGGLVPGELEIYGQLITATGSGVGPNDYRLSDAGGIGDPSFETWEPAVAYNPDDNQYLVIWRGEDNVGGMVDGETEIFSQRLTADLSGLGPNDYRLSDVGGIGDPSFFVGNAPDVAYNPLTHEYAVVWWGEDNVGGMVNGEAEVFCQLLTADVVGVGPNDGRISDIGGIGSASGRQPRWTAIAANPTNGQFLAVWGADDDGGGTLAISENEIYGQRVTGTAVLIDGFESGDTSAWSAASP